MVQHMVGRAHWSMMQAGACAASWAEAVASVLANGSPASVGQAGM
ncbi:hypothetical protein [Sphingobium yanoikuyae]|nr:hypothetical protein [Sphingobium yanoikuyae]